MSTPFPRLRPGQRFRLHPDCTTPASADQVYLVIRVTDCSATVRPLAAKHVTIQSPDGSPIADFWKAGTTHTISPHSSVLPLPEEGDPCLTTLCDEPPTPLPSAAPPASTGPASKDEPISDDSSGRSR